MSAGKYSDDFKEQVVLEVINKDRTISSVAHSYGLVAQTVGLWVRKYRQAHPEVSDSGEVVESAEIRRLRRELAHRNRGCRSGLKPPASSSDRAM